MTKVRYVLFGILMVILTMIATLIPFTLVFLIEYFQGVLYADDTYLSILTVHHYHIGLVVSIAALFLSLFLPFAFKKEDDKYGYDNDEGEGVYYPMYSTGHRLLIILLSLLTCFFIYASLTSYVKIDIDRIAYKNTVFQEKVYTFDDVEHIHIEATYQSGRRTRGIRFLYRIDMTDGLSVPFHQKHLNTDFDTLFMINEIFKDMDIPRSGYITERFKKEFPRSEYYNEETKAWFEIP